jgi:5-methylcytosine-specific restriction protein A
VVAHVDPGTGELVSQLATGEPLPPSVLELLACNASITGVLYDTAGTPLWRGTTKRTATAAQLKALTARDGGCVGCGCHPALCQAHHIKPASQGGPTTISNMVLLCWNCHHKVHHNQWTVVRRRGRFELLPPVRTRWGPARAPDPPATQPTGSTAATGHLELAR